MGLIGGARSRSVNILKHLPGLVESTHDKSVDETRALVGKFTVPNKRKAHVHPERSEDERYGREVGRTEHALYLSNRITMRLCMHNAMTVEHGLSDGRAGVKRLNAREYGIEGWGFRAHALPRVLGVQPRCG